MNLNRIFVVFLCHFALFGSASISHADSVNQVGSIKINADKEKGRCDIEMRYQEEIYKQTVRIKNEDDLSNFFMFLNVGKRPLNTSQGHHRMILESSNEEPSTFKDQYFVYELVGHCGQFSFEDESLGENNKINFAAIQIGMPSAHLVHDDRLIVAGKKPAELLEQEFSLTMAPILKNHNPLYSILNSSDPSEIEKYNRQLQSLPQKEVEAALNNTSSSLEIETKLISFDSFLSINENVKNESVDFWSCFLSHIKLRDGTLTLAPITKQNNKFDHESNELLGQYTVEVDRWEFQGRFFGYSC